MPDSPFLEMVHDTSFAQGKMGIYARDSAGSDEADTVQFDNVRLVAFPQATIFLPLVTKQ